MPADEPTNTLWDQRLLANPHAVADKRRRIQRMFAAIAPRYDLNNRLHSLWQDQRWRRKAVRLSGMKAGDVVVDVACGTGDLALKFAEAGPARVIGVDFAHAMLPLAMAKADLRWAGHGGCPVGFVGGDALRLPLRDECCDVVSIAFGIRNVSDPPAAILEFRRILRCGGRLVILEFSLPSNRVLRGLYNLYFRRVLPRTATLISGDRTGAYRYLPESVNTFLDRPAMLAMMREGGFTQVQHYPMAMGICVCYVGVKG